MKHNCWAVGPVGINSSPTVSPLEGAQNCWGVGSITWTPQHPNRSSLAPFDVIWAYKRSRDKTVQTGRVVRHTLESVKSHFTCVGHPVENFDQRGAVAVDERRELDNGESSRVIAQRGENKRIERRGTLQRPMAACAFALPRSCTTGSVHLLPDVARRTGRDQIGEIVGAALAVGDDVVDMQHDGRRELSAVAARELVALKHDPSSFVPPIRGLALSSHEVSLAHFAQFTHSYQMTETVQ